MNDPLLRIARDRALLRQVSDYVDLDRQLKKIVEFRPIITMLAKARDEAANAMVALVLVDPSDTKQVTKHQNDARRFDDLIRWTKQIIAEGKDAEQIIEARGDTFEDLLDWLHQTDQIEEAEMLGIIERNDNADA